MLTSLIIGQVAPGGLTQAIAHGLEHHGVETIVVNWPGEYLSNSLVSLAYRHPLIARPWKSSLHAEIARWGRVVDFVLLVKGPLFEPRDIRRLRAALAAPVICWNPDSPFDHAFSNRGAGLLDAVGHYDLYVTWADDVAQKLRAAGQATIVIPFGWDQAAYFPSSRRILGLSESAVFVGTHTPEREALLLRVQKRVRLVVFGSGWNSHSSLTTGGPVYGHEYRQVITSAACAINLLRDQNRHSHNMRSFEIPACGGVQVTARTDDHLAWLQSNTVLFETHAEIDDAVQQAVSAPRRWDGIPRWMAAHTYAQRTSELLRRLSGS